MAEENKEFDVEVAGQKIHTRGYRFTDMLILFAFLAVGAAAVFVFQDMRQQRVELAIKTQQDHEHIVKSIGDLKGALSEQTYVLTLKQEDRERLRLDMPESLRAKVYYPPDRGR